KFQKNDKVRIKGRREAKKFLREDKFINYSDLKQHELKNRLRQVANERMVIKWINQKYLQVCKDV
ncbi:MAG: hypothetical protein K2L51_04945, partial [Clostridiales bacterium]|nr:hypothetical protein [Clostridiales bacterium]